LGKVFVEKRFWTFINVQNQKAGGLLPSMYAFHTPLLINEKDIKKLKKTI